MRVGTYIAELGTEGTDVASLQARARWADLHGLATAWVPHSPWSLDALTAVALAAQVTDRIELGTAVVPTFPRHPLALAQQALSVQAACRGRLALGIGPSHPIVVEQMHGLRYERPFTHTREYVEVLARAFAGSRRVRFDGDVFRVDAPLGVPGAAPVPVLVAGLGPKMLHLAGSQAAGTITWMADEQAIADHVAPRVVAAAVDAGRPAPRIVAGVPVAVCDDPAEGRAAAARAFAMYATIPAYQRILALGDADDISAVCAVGTEAQVRGRLERFRDAGVTDLAAVVFPVGDDAEATRRRTGELLAALAPDL
jgi:F420-dependent oxidoreductase-like protein